MEETGPSDLEKEPYPLNKTDALELLALGGFKGSVNLDDPVILDALSAVYGKGHEDGRFSAQSEYNDAPDWYRAEHPDADYYFKIDTPDSDDALLSKRDAVER